MENVTPPPEDVTKINSRFDLRYDSLRLTNGPRHAAGTGASVDSGP